MRALHALLLVSCGLANAQFFGFGNNTNIEDEGPFVPFRKDSLFGLQTSKGHYCFLAAFSGRLVIKAFRNYQFPTHMLVDPSDPAMRIDGSCARRPNRASLRLGWNTGPGVEEEDSEERDYDIGSMVFEMEFRTIDWNNPVTGMKSLYWKLSNASLTFEPIYGNTGSPKAVLVNTQIGGTQDKSPTGINAPMGQSLYCRNSLNVTMASWFNNVTQIIDVTFQFKPEFLLQPFEVEPNGQFASRFLCQRSRKLNLLEQMQSRSSIAMGIMTTLMALGTIVAYSIKRRYFPDKTFYNIVK